MDRTKNTARRLKLFTVSGFCCLLLAGRFPAAAADAGETLTIENEHWRVTVSPRWGGRAASVFSLDQGHDFVTAWGEPREIRERMAREGGALRGIMTGTYASEQPESPYEVASRSKEAVRMVFEHEGPLLGGLREVKEVSLKGREVVFAARVTNDSEEARFIYYRVNDWLTAGTGRGRGAVCIVPESGRRTVAFTTGGPEDVSRHFVAPGENWYALADLVGNRGLLVSSRGPVAGIYFWDAPVHQCIEWGMHIYRRCCGPQLRELETRVRTAEFLFPRAKLAPGEAWEMEVRYAAFRPGDHDSAGPGPGARPLSAAAIDSYLAAEAGRVQQPVPPYHADLEICFREAPLTIAPVHHADRSLGGDHAPDYGMALRRVSLAGTPGDVVPFAFAVTAERPLSGAAVAFAPLRGRRRRSIDPGSFEPRFVAGESRLLVKSWDLANNIPWESISHVNNEVVDAAELTPFSLAAGESAWIRVNLRIPEAAAAGEYTGSCGITLPGGESVSFEISLAVHPFRLARAGHKTYGTFFDYHIQPQEGELTGRNAPYALSREDYFEVMKVFRDIGFRALAIYVSRRDDLLWVLDRCVELGLDGDFVLLAPRALEPGDVAGRGLTAYAWTVDEPMFYSQVPAAQSRYRSALGTGFRPTVSVNSPLGLVISDHLEEMVPIINPDGNAPYLAAAAGRYREAGRKVFWYECYGLGDAPCPVNQRALRGIYLWKEPHDGIFDWDNSSNRPGLSPHHMAGFAGTRVIPRLGLENTRQALTDLDYLHTLEKAAAATGNARLAAEAEELMGWIRERFDSDYRRVLPYITDAQYLDDVRGRVAEMIGRLAAGR